MGGSINGGTPKSSIYRLGYWIINHPFGDTSIYGNPYAVRFCIQTISNNIKQYQESKLVGLSKLVFRQVASVVSLINLADNLYLYVWNKETFTPSLHPICGAHGPQLVILDHFGIGDHPFFGRVATLTRSSPTNKSDCTNCQTHKNLQQWLHYMGYMGSTPAWLSSSDSAPSSPPGWLLRLEKPPFRSMIFPDVHLHRKFPALDYQRVKNRWWKYLMTIPLSHDDPYESIETP